MKRSFTRLTCLIVVVAGAGCGGSKDATSSKQTTPAEPPCTTMAAHVSGLVAEGGEAAEVIGMAVRESCEADGWSAEAIDCMSKITVDLNALVFEQTKEEKMGGCGAVLTEAQLQGMGRRAVEEVDRRAGRDPTDEPDEQPVFDVPPPPPPPPPKN